MLKAKNLFKIYRYLFLCTKCEAITKNSVKKEWQCARESSAILCLKKDSKQLLYYSINYKIYFEKNQD
jgi:hypothetical protein